MLSLASISCLVETSTIFYFIFFTVLTLEIVKLKLHNFTIHYIFHSSLYFSQLHKHKLLMLMPAPDCKVRDVMDHGIGPDSWSPDPGFDMAWTSGLCLCVLLAFLLPVISPVIFTA